MGAQRSAEWVLSYIRRRSRTLKATGCWVWQGAKCGDGYAGCNRAGERMVSRLAWRAARGLIPLPDGMEADHLCRNRLCVNPEHIEAVTLQENRRRRSAARVR